MKTQQNATFDQSCWIKATKTRRPERVRVERRQACVSRPAAVQIPGVFLVRSSGEATPLTPAGSEEGRLAPHRRRAGTPSGGQLSGGSSLSRSDSTRLHLLETIKSSLSLREPFFSSFLSLLLHLPSSVPRCSLPLTLHSRTIGPKETPAWGAEASFEEGQKLSRRRVMWRCSFRVDDG